MTQQAQDTGENKISKERMEAAILDSTQLNELIEAEKKLNRNNNGKEIYLLAVTRE